MNIEPVRIENITIENFKNVKKDIWIWKIAGKIIRQVLLGYMVRTDRVKRH